MAENSVGNVKGSVMSLFQNNRTLVIVVVVAVVIIAWLYVSSGIKVRNVEQTAAAQQSAMVKQAEERQAETVKQSLELFGTPLAWAVRREMMSGNMAQIDQYVTDLVKQKGFEQVVVAKEDGKIVVASDRKNLGIKFSSLYSDNNLKAKMIEVEDKGQGKWLLVVPVMGLNARLGTIAIEYQAAVAPAAAVPAGN